MKKNILCIGALALSMSLSAHAGFINFESDATGAFANGGASFDDSGVHFTDTIGADLQIGAFNEGIGQSMVVFGDDTSRLEINFDFTVDSLELFFGNDDPNYTTLGDSAWLEVFQNGASVGLTSLAVNSDDIMNQSLAFAGVDFNSALFWYGDANGLAIDLIEVVDNISYNNVSAVPIPAAALLFGPALLGFFGFRRKMQS